MKILSADELYARLDFMSPIHPPEEQKLGVYCIPFEYGDQRKGTRISIAKAKEIVAELRADIAEAEKQQLREAFDAELKRGEERSRQHSQLQDELMQAKQESAQLRVKLHRMRRKK